jgi:uncharacterized protein YceK
MKKIILITLMLCVLTLSGCGRFDRWWAGTTGSASKTCVDGVTYLQFTSGAAVQVDLNGKPVACK